MKLPIPAPNLPRDLKEFDIWITSSLGEIPDTEKFKEELARVTRTFEEPGQATNNFAEIGELPPTAQKPVIVTDMDIRRFVRKLVEVEFPNVPVLFYQELSPDLTIQPIARIALPHGGRLAA